jgi:hypothetical protein
MYNTKNYTEQGGDRTVIGGEIDIITGGAIKVAGVEMKAAVESLSNKTLVEPEILNSYAAHDYAGAAVDWTLSAAEGKKKYLIATNANGAVNAIIPTGKNFKEYVVVNTSGQALTVKCPSGTGIVVASTKTAMVYFDGTNMKRLTADV